MLRCKIGGEEISHRDGRKFKITVVHRTYEPPKKKCILLQVKHGGSLPFFALQKIEI